MKKNRFLLLIVAAFALAVTSCKKEKTDCPMEEEPVASATTGDLVIGFAANYDGGPFVLDQSYDLNNGFRVKVQKIEFYITEIALVNATDTVQISEVEYLKWETGDTAMVAAVAPGMYTEVLYNIGVAPQWNVGNDPSVYTTDHPLSIFNGMHWGWAGGYIFNKLEAKVDTTATGAGLFDRNVTYHCGSDTLLRTKTFSLPISVTVGGTTQVIIPFNVHEFFESGTDVLDVTIDHTTHTASNLPLAIRYTNLFTAAIEEN